MSTFATTTLRRIRGMNHEMISSVLPIQLQPRPVTWPFSSRASGGERTRTADFHVAKVDPTDFGGLLRHIAAGQKVIHTLANYPAQPRPRDRRAMCESVSDLRVAAGSRVASRRWRDYARHEVRAGRFF